MNLQNLVLVGYCDMYSVLFDFAKDPPFISGDACCYPSKGQSGGSLEKMLGGG